MELLRPFLKRVLPATAILSFIAYAATLARDHARLREVDPGIPSLPRVLVSEAVHLVWGPALLFSMDCPRGGCLLLTLTALLATLGRGACPLDLKIVLFVLNYALATLLPHAEKYLP